MKNMKFTALIKITAVFALIFALTACGSAAQNAQVTSIALSDGATQGEDTSDGANALALLPEGANAFFPADVPSFLTTDLQELYKAAYYLTYHHNVSAGINVDPNAPTIQDENGNVYYKDNGYATYDDYKTALNSVFVDGFSGADAEIWNAAYRQGDDGALYTSTGARGTNIEYVSTSFEPVSDDESTITFLVVGHYDSSLLEADSDAPAAMYEADFRTILIKTENGWRFAQFNIPI